MEQFTSNAEYAMLLVHVLMVKKWILKVMHIEIVCFCLLFAVSCVMFTLFTDHSSVASRFNMIISIPKKQVLMEGKQQQSVRAGIAVYTAVLTTVSHCASFYIVCGLHPANMLSEKNWNTVYSLNIGISEALSPLLSLSIRYCPLFFYLLKTKASCVVVLF